MALKERREWQKGRKEGGKKRRKTGRKEAAFAFALRACVAPHVPLAVHLFGDLHSVDLAKAIFQHPGGRPVARVAHHGMPPCDVASVWVLRFSVLVAGPTRHLYMSLRTIDLVRASSPLNRPCHAERPTPLGVIGFGFGILDPLHALHHVAMLLL